MQQKMNANQSLKPEQSRRSSSNNNNNNNNNNVGRRQITRANTHPYYRNNKINSENCYKCDENGDYINVLNARFTRIEGLVENLSKAVKSTSLTRKVGTPTSSVFGSVNLSKMSIEELLSFSSQLGIHLFDNLDKEKKKNPPTQNRIEKNENKENKILKNIEIDNNSNDFQNVKP